MVTEMRAVRAELDHRRHFTEPKQPIELTRDHIDQWTSPREAEPLELVTSRTAGNLNTAAEHDLIEVG
jgi:hypothetical protein